MSHYRLYGLNGDGRFFRCAEFEAESDDEACGRSIVLRGVDAAELWAGGRFVTTFKAAGAVAAGDQSPASSPSSISPGKRQFSLS